MRTIRLPIAALLAGCLPLAASGCYTAYEYAAESVRNVSTGMTMAEVRARLGNPDLVVRGDPGTETSWFYRYDGGPGTACVVFLVIFCIVLLVALVAAGGGGGGGFGNIGGGGGGDGPPLQVKLTFDPEGRLVEVSEPYPATGR